MSDSERSLVDYSMTLADLAWVLFTSSAPRIRWEALDGYRLDVDGFVLTDEQVQAIHWARREVDAALKAKEEAGDADPA